jgi:penicillin-binding protein 1C
MVNAFSKTEKQAKSFEVEVLYTTSHSFVQKRAGRTYFEKIIELILATRLNWGILKTKFWNCMLHAPFGKCCGSRNGFLAVFWVSNLSIVMGRECNIGCFKCAWLIYQGGNQIKLLSKRNRLC